MGTVLFRRNTVVFQGKNRSQRREPVRFGLMEFDSLLLYLMDLFGEKNMFYAGGRTFVFTVVNGEETVSRYEQKGYYYDSSEF